MSAHLAQLCLRGLSRGGSVPARCRGFAVSASANAAPRTYTAFTIYKGKSALEVKPLGPTLEVAGTGFKVAREGGFLLEIAPATGPKTYDWQSKITFFLSVNELGALIHSFGAGGQGALELLHDQNAGTSSAGKDRDAFKKLKAARMPDGATMFSIYEGDKGYNLPVSHSEMVVLLELARFTIPRALGFDKGMEAITQ